MKTVPEHTERRIAPLSDELLSRPLDFLLADHLRQRRVWDLIEEVATAVELDAALVAEILGFLRVDLAHHVLDEEEYLFPLLCKCCQPEDEIDAVIAQLRDEHSADERGARDLIAALEALVDGDRPAAEDPGLRVALLAFAQHQRRHLALENSIVLPIARLRLKSRDLAPLARRMMARRGIQTERPQSLPPKESKRRKP